MLPWRKHKKSGTPPQQGGVVIREILDRHFVLACLNDVRTQLGELAGSTGRRRSGPGELPTEFKDLAPADLKAAHEAAMAAQERETHASSGQEGFDPPRSQVDLAGIAAGRRGASEPALDSRVFLSRDPDICTLQSALDEYFATRAPERVGTDAAPASTARAADGRAETRRSDVDTSRAGVTFEPPDMVTDRYLLSANSGRRLLEQFSVTDIRWISCLFAMAKRKFSKRHAFVTTPATCSIASRARLAVVGDWASGLPRAINVAQQMRTVLQQGMQEGIEQHAIHLGDTYYSGWPSEYRRRFLPHWPVSAAEAHQVPSWSLNANHDMYSGGDGYYDTLLRDPRFARQEGCSFFSLHSPHWRVLGLDTGWRDGDLEAPQGEWVRNQCEEAHTHNQKMLLLSHHQLFSCYERGSNGLQAAIGELLQAGRIHAWIWGHEHRCVVYGPHAGLQYAACVGHGGVPVYMYQPEGGPYPAPAIWEDRRFIDRGLEHWAYMGFCVLDFDAEHLAVRYIDENGKEIHSGRIA